MVPEARLELARGFPQRFLRPPRLPFRHSGNECESNYTTERGLPVAIIIITDFIEPIIISIVPRTDRAVGTVAALVGIGIVVR